jgi:hypothetical protein
MKKKLIILMAIMLPFASLAQSFMPKVVAFSSKKTAYVFNEQGEKIPCIIKGMKWKKGSIDGIKIEDLEGNKIKMTPEQISKFYAPPSGLQKLGNALDFMDSPGSWGDTDLDKALLGEKLSYFEKTAVKIKKKEFVLCMQVLNPTYCKHMRVYGDNRADDNLLGDAKSYFIKASADKAAYLIERKNYKDEFAMIFSDSPEVLEKYGADPKWGELEKHVFLYDQSKK